MTRPDNSVIGRLNNMEKFTLSLQSQPQQRHCITLCGVVSSGNLEVLVEKTQHPDSCEFEISTSALGFRDIWQAVLKDFAARHAAGGLKFSINDAGATPAVVSLRLDQAVEICSREVT